MALTTCKECGKEVAKKAKTCPHCGTEKPGQGGTQVSAGMGCLVIVVATGLISALLITSGDPGSRPAPPDLGVDLNAAVQNTGTQIVVTNRDTFEWTSCRITINSDYSQEVSRIGPGEQVAGGLLAFVRRNGERFQPAEYAVQDVSVSCDTPNGDGFYYGGF